MSAPLIAAQPPSAERNRARKEAEENVFRAARASKRF